MRQLVNEPIATLENIFDRAAIICFDEYPGWCQAIKIQPAQSFRFEPFYVQRQKIDMIEA